MKTLIRAGRARRWAALAMLCLVLCGCAGAEGAPTACQDIALYSWGFVSQASDQSNTAYQVLEYRMPADQDALVDEYVRAIQSEAGWTLSDSFSGSGYCAWALRAPDGAATSGFRMTLDGHALTGVSLLIEGTFSYSFKKGQTIAEEGTFSLIVE